MRVGMKLRLLIWTIAVAVLADLAVPLRIAADDDRDGKQPELVTIDVAGAGTAPLQGTLAFGITPAGAITGFIRDANNRYKWAWYKAAGLCSRGPQGSGFLLQRTGMVTRPKASLSMRYFPAQHIQRRS